MPDHSFSGKCFPNIQSKPPLTQPEAIASCPITCYLREETNICLATPSFQVAVESDKCLVFWTVQLFDTSSNFDDLHFCNTTNWNRSQATCNVLLIPHIRHQPNCQQRFQCFIDKQKPDQKYIHTGTLKQCFSFRRPFIFSLWEKLLRRII